MPLKTLRKNGREYVVVPRAEYERLVMQAKAVNLPPLPKPGADGNYPALEYVRATIARDIVRDRITAGLTQRELARRAGIRVETLCRIETGKHTASVPTIDRIDRALQLAASKRHKPRLK
jgi:DNA-binding XRE family transcriptional regulator